MKRTHSFGIRLYGGERKSAKERALNARAAYEKKRNAAEKADILYRVSAFPDESAFFPGNTVLFGAYPRVSPNASAPVEWIVLETDGATALCIAKDCLFTSRYCETKTAEGEADPWTWENSLARAVCGRFFQKAFSAEEKARFVPKVMSGDAIGKRCRDFVFLLSAQEAQRFFPSDAERKAKPTVYAIRGGAWRGMRDDTREYTAWWLLPEKTKGGFMSGAVFPKYVQENGVAAWAGRNTHHADFTIRPCIRIRYKNDFATRPRIKIKYTNE